jgi:hypothetical protein
MNLKKIVLHNCSEGSFGWYGMIKRGHELERGR